MDLDLAYTNGAFIAGADAYPARWAAQAQAFRDGLGARAALGLAYGMAERQHYDLFRPEGPPRGTVIFVHGGYWKAFHRSDWSHLAAGPLARGWAVAMPSYTLAPEARIAAISAEIAAAVAAIAQATTGPMILTGVVTGGRGGNMAIIESGGASYIVSEGDYVNDFWVVRRVYREMVVLRAHDREVSLYFDQPPATRTLDLEHIEDEGDFEEGA